MVSNQTEYADKCNKSNKLKKVRSIINQYVARENLSSDKLSLKEELEHMSFADIVDYAWELEKCLDYICMELMEDE